MSSLDTLARLRAYAAAHPTDVQVVRETIQWDAEMVAYRQLSALARRWRARARKERCANEAESRAIVNALLSRTLRGMQAPAHLREPYLHEIGTLVSEAPPPLPEDDEPVFPLVRRAAPPMSGVRARAPAATLAGWLQSRTSHWRSTASRS